MEICENIKNTGEETQLRGPLAVMYVLPLQTNAFEKVEICENTENTGIGT